MDEMGSSRPLIDMYDSPDEEEQGADTRASTPNHGQQVDEFPHHSPKDSWVTRRNPVGEITSLISSLYISDHEEDEQSLTKEEISSSTCLL